MVLVSPGRLVWRASSHAYILKEPYRPPACMLTDYGGLFSEFFVILYLFRLYGGNAQLPCLLLMDDFAAAIACIVICFVRMARLPSPQLGLLLDGLTSYPLPCLTLPVRWGSKVNQYVKVLFYCAGGGIEPPFAKTEPATDYREGGLFGTPFRCYRPSCIFFATSRQCRRAYIEPSGLFLRGSNIHLRPIGSVYSLKC